MKKPKLIKIKEYDYDRDGSDLTVFVTLTDGREIKICTYEECLCDEAEDEGICEMIEETILEQEGYELM